MMELVEHVLMEHPAGAREAARSFRSAVGTRTPRLLLVCGPTGVGKTHLLRAIADDVRTHRPDVTLVRTTGVDFRQALVEAVRGSSDVLRCWLGAQCLVVDDLQVLRGMSRVQVEVGHRLRNAVAAGASVVCALGRGRPEVPELFDTLRRLPSARMVELRPLRPPRMRRLLRTMAGTGEAELIPAQLLDRVSNFARGDVGRALGALATWQLQDSVRRNP